MFVHADSPILTWLSTLNSFQLIFTKKNLANVKICKPKQAPKLVKTVQIRQLESVLYFFPVYLWMMSTTTMLAV